MSISNSIFSKVQELNVTELAFSFNEEVVKMLIRIPSYEKFNIIDQFTRASESVYKNLPVDQRLTIAKIYDRINISLGSIAECMALLDSCYSLNYINASDYERLNTIAESIFWKLAEVLKTESKEGITNVCS